MDKDYWAAVFIGRFQPFHNAHFEVLRGALDVAQHVVILVGSSWAARTIKNPFTYHEREAMILKSIPVEWRDRVHVRPIRDYFYNDNIWCSAVQAAVGEFSDSHRICLVGSYKDDTSYYLKLFPNWQFVPFKQTVQMDATVVRELMFTEQKFTHMVPEGAGKEILDWCEAKTFDGLKHEYKYLTDYRKTWENAPHKPIFVTVDAVVVQSGHVLLVKRKYAPGRGLYALPGGFIKPNEYIQDGALRELREETGIKVAGDVLRNCITETKVFDYPARSLRGRTITHAHLIMLNNGPLPELQADDDAAEAKWVAIADIYKYPEMFFEDHFSIIDSLLMRGK